MKLVDVLKDLDYQVLQGDLKMDVTGICFDSRKIKDKDLFIAVKGFNSNGHDYIDDVIKKGCKIIVLEEHKAHISDDVCVILVKNSRETMGLLASNFYHKPTHKMNMVGITGTNGKTSITFFIKSILKTSKASVGIIGTMGVWLNEKLNLTHNTTPESVILQDYCSHMVDENISHCLMEVSSHALELHRVAGCDFNTAIFTNLTPDHLELHGDMNSYFEAKAKLFQMSSYKNIINVDDKYGEILYTRHLDNTITYGLKNRAMIYPTNIDSHLEGSHFTLNTPEGSLNMSINLPGEIYIYNALAASAWAYAEGFSLEMIAKGLGAVKTITGRFETVYHEDEKCVIVDFSHTEDSLEKALLTLTPFVKNKLKVLFGVYAAPGALGLDKRQAMARVASKFSDYAYVTSDNPKDNDPEEIIKDICQEMDKVKAEYTSVLDRKKAIHLALSQLEKGDVLLIAGKGHERTQVINGQALPFCEKDIVRDYMKATEREI